MASLRSFTAVAMSALGVAQAALSPAQSCPSSPQLSCHTSGSQDTCCTNSPGGLLLQVQLWDVNPSAGPDDSWTIHGLWPDNCNGGYSENCDSSRDYKNITQIIEASGNSTLLNDMQTYWPSNEGSAESFWEHEVGTHMTCISTLDPDCFNGYTPGAEVPLFFKTVVDLFFTLPTYKWLANAGITPSSSKKYSATAIQSALENEFGAEVYISCYDGVLESVEYYFNVKGTAQSGTYVPTDATSSSSCSGSVSYPPK